MECVDCGRSEETERHGRELRFSDRRPEGLSALRWSVSQDRRDTVKACMNAIEDRYNRELAELEESRFTAYDPLTGSATAAHFVEDVNGTKPATMNLISIPPPFGTHTSLY